MTLECVFEDSYSSCSWLHHNNVVHFEIYDRYKYLSNAHDKSGNCSVLIQSLTTSDTGQWRCQLLATDSDAQSPTSDAIYLNCADCLRNSNDINTNNGSNTNNQTTGSTNDEHEGRQLLRIPVLKLRYRLLEFSILSFSKLIFFP